MEVPIRASTSSSSGWRARYSTLLHGSVIGVPIGADLPAADERPSADEVTGTVGLDIDDVAAAFAGRASGSPQRQLEGRLFAAFTANLLSRLATSDGLVDLEEHEHADAFWPMPGKPCPGPRPIACAPRGPCALCAHPCRSQVAGRPAATRMRGRGLSLESVIQWRGGWSDSRTRARGVQRLARRATRSPVWPAPPKPLERREGQGSLGADRREPHGDASGATIVPAGSGCRRAALDPAESAPSWRRSL